MYPIKMRGAKRNKNAIPQGVLNTIRVSVTVRKINVVLALDFFFTHERQLIQGVLSIILIKKPPG